MIISFKKILLTLLPIICFSSAFADKPLVEDILQSGALPTGSATLALIGDKNGESVTQSVLQGNSFWSADAGINWDPSTTATDTVGNPWLKFAPAIPVHRKGQEGYSSFYDTTITVASTDDYKKITGLYGYKITINLTSNLDFEGESLPPLFNIVAFIGNNHTISNFSIKCDGDYAGLLSTVSDSVCDLTLRISDFKEIILMSYAGTLVGRLFSGGKIKNCHVINNTAGVVQVWGTSYLGGLVGYSEGTIEGCSVSRIDVRAMGNHAGGLVGYAKGKISNCSVDTAKVEAKEKCVGGLVGYTNSEIEGCSVTKPSVSSFSGTTSSCYVGGLVGLIEGVSDVKNCTVKNATVTGNSYLGGLIGRVVAGTGTIKSCLVETPTVTGTADYVGGLIGNLVGFKEVSNCTVKTPTIKGNLYLGGLIGMAKTNASGGEIISCSVETPTIQGANNTLGSRMGGLIGELVGTGTISDCNVKTATLTGITMIGGLIGYNSDADNSSTGSVKKCSVDSVAITATQEHVGGLVGNISELSNFDSCTVKYPTLKGRNCVGGLIGNITTENVKVSNSSVDSANVEAGDFVGGLIGYIDKSGDVTKCTVETLLLKGATNLGGLIGYVKTGSGSISSCSVRHATVQPTSSGIGTNMGGLIGLIGGNRAISECKVMDGPVTGRNILGGLIGSNAGTTTISKCCVGNVPVTATSDRVGGLIGYNKGNISDCSVSYTALSTGTYIGGIVGYNEGATVLRCLVTGTTITSSNTNADDGFVAGVVGYNFGGWVKNCVAMIKYFDIKARYTKNGQKFGRIVSNHGNLSNNYGWVETAIRYYYYRFGINWGTDYYKGTGQTYQDYRNGENLFIGDKHYSTALKMAKESSFWTGIGFTSNNGWSTTDVGRNYYPKLTFVQGVNLGSIGTARGFEYEAHLIATYDGNYILNYSNGTNFFSGPANIFTPQFFSRYINGGYCAYLGNSQCHLYTDIELATEDNSGNTVFWSTDLNGGRPHNFSYSAIRVSDDRAGYFDGHGHSIIGLHKEHSNSYDANDRYSSGFIHAPNSDLTIKRLELEDPYVDLRVYSVDGAYVRYGFLVCESDRKVELEDIYIKNPKMYVESRYWLKDLAFKSGVNGFVGTMIGKVNTVRGKRLVVYMPDGSYIKSQYAHLGCFFGFVYKDITLDSIATSIYTSAEQINSFVQAEGGYLKTTTPDYGTPAGAEYAQFFSMGYICAVGTGVGSDNTTSDYTTGSSSFRKIALHDGNNGYIGRIRWADYFPSNTFMAPLPFIIKLGETIKEGSYGNCGGDYLNAGSFDGALAVSGIDNDSNWMYNTSNPAESKLKRDEYTGNYQ